MKASLLFAVLLLVTSEARPRLQDEAGGAVSSGDAREAFGWMKGLVGSWTAVDDEDEAVLARYRLSAGGHALVETLFPGEHHEMLTVYHTVGDELRLHHYCMLGNQPRMKARVDRERRRIDWEFTGGGNIEPARTPHMHRARFHFLGPDRIRFEWDLFADGQRSETKRFDLRRLPDER